MTAAIAGPVDAAGSITLIGIGGPGPISREMIHQVIYRVQKINTVRKQRVNCNYSFLQYFHLS